MNKEYYKNYYQKHKDELKKRATKYYQQNKDKYVEYYQQNKEQILERHKQNQNSITEYTKKYRKTAMGRANMLLQRYKQSDKKCGRGECTLTAKWIVENIFTKPCAHCGETDWYEIGCNRLDNTKPHTMDNVEPCCGKCNVQLH